MNRLGWLAAGVVVLGIHTWYGPDIWYHLYLGDRILATGQLTPPDQLVLQTPAYDNQYWLFQILASLVFRLSGVVGVSALFCGLWLATLWAWARTVRLERWGELGIVVGLIHVLIWQIRFEERPEIVSFTLLAFHILWHSEAQEAGRFGRARFAWIVGTQGLWRFAHSYHLIGPVLTFLSWVGLRKRGTAIHREAGMLVGIQLAITFVPQLISHRTGQSSHLALAWSSFVSTPLDIQEMTPTLETLRGLRHLPFWVLIAGVIGLGFSRAKRLDFAALCAVLGTVVSLKAVRYVPFLPLLASPLLRDWVTARTSHEPKRVSPLLPATLLSGLVIAIVTNAGYQALDLEARFGFGLSPGVYPVEAGQHLDSIGFRGKLFAHPTDGSYLESLHRGFRVYTDSRFLDPDATNEYFNALSDYKALQGLQRQNGFDAWLIQVAFAPPVLVRALTDPDWRLIYADLHRALFAPTSSDLGKTAAVLRFYNGEDLSIRPEGAGAILWLQSASEAGRSDLVRAFAAQISSAKAIPAPAISALLTESVRHRDLELARVALSLRGRMVALSAVERERVDQLAAQVPISGR